MTRLSVKRAARNRSKNLARYKAARGDQIRDTDKTRCLTMLPAGYRCPEPAAHHGYCHSCWTS